MKWALLGQCLIIVALLYISSRSEEVYSDNPNQSKSENEIENHMRAHNKKFEKVENDYGVTTVIQEGKKIPTMLKNP